MRAPSGASREKARRRACGAANGRMTDDDDIDAAIASFDVKKGDLDRAISACENAQAAGRIGTTEFQRVKGLADEVTRHGQTLKALIEKALNEL